MEKGKWKKEKSGNNRWSFLPAVFTGIAMFAVICVFAAQAASAQSRSLSTPLPNEPELNPNSSAFKLSVCDGPNDPRGNARVEVRNDKGVVVGERKYVVCDFNAAMILIQHLINIMMVVGVFAAMGGLLFAGGLYITGKKGNIDKAHAIFPKIFIGFIIMLSAWFIVYQILSWFTKDSAFKALLGSP